MAHNLARTSPPASAFGAVSAVDLLEMATERLPVPVSGL